MDKTAIKNFAVRARRKLIEQVKQKAYEIGIEKGNITKPQIKEDNLIVINEYKKLNNKEYEQRQRLINEIEIKGYEQVMEEVAYTWFNRFVALRFMEVNGYLPTGVRVLSSETEGKVEPDIIAEALNVDLDIDPVRVYEYQDRNDINGLYKYLLIKQCNALNEIMPFIFEKIADYTEILLPDNLLSEGSVIRDMVESIAEEDWGEQVEIIGWLYQFYISEKKDEVFASKGKVKKEEIPAATQLFTPDWIVKYMVENSLGRYWLEAHPDENLKKKWKYYLEEPEQEPEVQKKLEEIRNRNINPEEITVLDPACGSGHILVYAFDVLYEIYRTAGYLETDIPQLILNKNIYGLEICDRAGQLASLSVMMKAREKDSRIFEKEINLNICSIQETNRISNHIIELLLEDIEDNGKKDIIQKDLKYLLDVYKDAKMYGSIINVEQINAKLLQKQVEELKERKVDNLFDIPNKYIILDLLPKTIKQAEIMSNKYDIAITNPPYMKSGGMNHQLKNYLKKFYKKSKKDLFAVFIKKCLDYSKDKSYIAMITMHSWMFIKSFKSLRKELINNVLISSLVHLGSRAFEEISGELVQTVSFVIQNYSYKKYKGNYIRLVDFNKPELKHKEFFNKRHRYISNLENFEKISEFPLSYWASDKIIEIFKKGTPLNKLANPKQGLITGNNSRFLRYWFEINFNKIGFEYKSRNDAQKSQKKWFPYKKGGSYKKWYGNNEYVVNWEDDGYEIRNFKTKDGRLRSRPQNMKYYFTKGLIWPKIVSSNFSVRYVEAGYIFSEAGMKIVTNNKLISYLGAFLNTKLVDNFLQVISETMNYEQGNISKIPILITNDTEIKQTINKLFYENIQIAKTDWDSFETSWDFKKHPLLTYKKEATTIEEAFNNWAEFAEKQFYQLKENEEELNRIFIKIYGLEDELTPEVAKEDVTVRKADRERDIKSFISYAVGCMLGRYSLDEEGLVYAGGEFDESRYKTFKVDRDGILPVLDDEYFDDDIVAKFIEFVKITFGEKHLEDNLDYIAETLGRKAKETSRQAIRRYFVNDFYKDHVQTYNKRPIYWLFQSGRRKAFNALIYMHRYDSGTVARVRTDYLHELQKKIEAEKVRLQGIIDSDLSDREKNNARKKLDKLNKDTEELIKYDEILNHLANQQIEIDLDDGVEVNYAKFAEVLASI
jgi:type II restriction/modification system DNA methylase subunit YeeA